MIFDLTANTNRRKLMVLDPSYPKDVSTTVIKGNTTSATFSVVITEPGSPDDYTYQWYVNGSAVSGANSPSYTRTGLSATATYNIYCEVTNNAGTVKSRVATLQVTQYYTPTLNSSYPADVATMDATGSMELKVAISTAGSPSSYTYQWYKNGSKISGATNSTYTFKPGTIGTYTFYCDVTNSAGTVTSRTATIIVNTMNLYNSGIINTDLVGNLTAYDYRPANSDAPLKVPTIIKGSSSITVSLDGDTTFGSGGSYFPDNAIDLTNYSKINIAVSAVEVTSGTIRLCVSESKANEFERVGSVNITSIGTKSYDISSLTGKYYLPIALYSLGNKSITFTRWWLST